jgi:hypothetical protein
MVTSHLPPYPIILHKFHSPRAQYTSIIEQFKPALYCLTGLLIASRVMVLGVTRH